MQNVATGKSELAALPLAFSIEPSAVIENSSEFSSLLQDASDKAFTQPVEPKMPETKGENQSPKSDPDQVDLQKFGEKSEIEKNQTISNPAISESAKNQQSIQEIDIELSEVQTSVQTEVTEQQNILPSQAVKAVDTNSKPNHSKNDLAADFDSVIPSIDLLVLLEQSQFKEITITPGKKVVEESQFDDIHSVVEYLKTLSEQTNFTEQADSPTILKEIDKFIAAFKAQKFEAESPVDLAKLSSKIPSDVELESNVVTSPANIRDEHLALDIELLSIVIANDQANTKTYDEANTKNHEILEGLLADPVDEIAEPIVKTTNLAVEVDLVNVDAGEALLDSALEDTVPIKLAEEIDNILASVAPKDTLVAVKAPDEKKTLNPSAESKDIQQLLALSPEKLDKALQNLADRLVHVDSTTDNGFEPQTKIVSTTKQDFIASLKTSIEEVKVQIKQGKQNDFDLKSIVMDNLNRFSQEINPESVSTTISRFSQTLELSSSLLAHGPAIAVRGLESSNDTGAMERVFTKDTLSQSNLMQTKQALQQAVTFEKAVNIVRSEGHQQLVEKVRWMVSQNNLQADIRLDPPDLGAMKVRISLSGETASVNIAVQSQQAKDLLDSAAPKLRELLEEQGIQLGQSSVEQEQQQKNHNHSNFIKGNSEFASETELEEASQVTEQVIVNGRLSGIDYFV